MTESQILHPPIPQAAVAMVGDRVVSLSGLWLGMVETVDVGKFLLNHRNGGRGTWLRADCVFHSQAGVLTLMYEGKDLVRCLVPGEAVDGEDRADSLFRPADPA